MALERTCLTQVRILTLDEGAPPTNYNMKSEFGKNPKTKAFSFGISREAYSKVY